MARGSVDFIEATRPMRWEPSNDQIPFWWTSDFNVNPGVTFTSAVFYTIPVGWRMCVLGISIGCDVTAIQQFSFIRTAGTTFQIHFDTECDVHFGHGAMEMAAGDTMRVSATNNAVGAANFRYNIHGYLVRAI